MSDTIVAKAAVRKSRPKRAQWAAIRQGEDSPLYGESVRSRCGVEEAEPGAAL